MTVGDVMKYLEEGNMNFNEIFNKTDEETGSTDDYYDQEYIDDMEEEDPEFAGFLRGYLDLTE